MLLSYWLNRVTNVFASRRPGRSKVRGVKKAPGQRTSPVLESLEVRSLLSTFVVDTLDTVAPRGSLGYATPALTESLTGVGDSDSYTINLDAGQTATIVLTPVVGLQVQLNLTDPSGTVVTSLEGNPGEVTLLQSASVPESGTYRLDVTSLAGAGSYAIRMWLNTAVELEQYRTSPNNTLATAEALTGGGSPASGGADRLMVQGTLNASSDAVDLYSFVVGAADVPHLVVTPLGAGPAPRLELLDSQGTLVAQGVAGATNVGAAIRDFTSATAGTYYVRLTQTTGQGSYSLLVVRNAAFDLEPNSSAETAQNLDHSHAVLGTVETLSLPSEIEPNNSIAEANNLSGSFSLTGPNTYRASVQGNISVTFERDYFKIFASPGDQITLDQVGSSLSDPYLYLYNRDGVLLASNDDYFGLNSHIVYTFGGANSNYTGEYYIAAGAYSTRTGTYTMTASLVTPAPLVSSGGEDRFAFHAQAGDPLVIRTITPGDGSHLPSNVLDPILDLYAPDGTLVASNDNGAADGRNAHLEYTVPAGAGGLYRVTLRSSSTTGDYFLTVGGATGSAPAFAIASVTPVAGAEVTSFPSVYRATFNQDLLLSTIQADDLRINGVAAGDVSFIDGRTLEFQLGNTNPGDGEYTATIAPGAIRSLTGETLPFFSSTFDLDATNPVVISSTVSQGAVLDTGDLVYQVQFSEELASTGLGGDDVELRRLDTSTTITVESFAYDAPSSTLTLSFAALEEGSYELRLRSGINAFRDRRNNLLDGGPSSPLPSGDGIAGDDFVLQFSVDTTTRAYPTPLESKSPAGSLVYDPLVEGAIHVASDVDTFTLPVEANQRITVVVTPEGALAPVVQLLAPDGTVLASHTAAAGQRGLIQVQPVVAGGTVQIAISSSGGTTGAYAVQVILNAQVEVEGGVASNNEITSAEDILPSLITLPGGTSRLAVIGASSLDDDYYQFSLPAGALVTLAVSPWEGSIAEFDLRDANGSMVAASTSDGTGGTNRFISNYLSSGGTYFARVRGNTGSRYNLVITRDANFDAEPFSIVQRLEGTGTLRVLGGIDVGSQGGTSHAILGNTTSPVEIENNNTIATSNDLASALRPETSTPNTYVATVAGTVSSTSDDDYFLIFAQAGDRLVLDQTGGTIGDTYVYLYDRNGQLLASDDDAGPGYDSHLVYNFGGLAYTGDYYIRADGYGSRTGTYTLTARLTTTQLQRSLDQLDVYSFRANAGDQLVIATSTPGDGAGEPVNPFDPVLELLDASGAVVASDSNGADDGRNAIIRYTVLQGGEFSVRLQGAEGGAYELTIAGSTANNLVPPSVVSVTPASAAPLAAAPDALLVTFSEGVRSDSVQLDDLLFSTPGVTVTGVQQIDGRTLRFELSIPDASGFYHYELVQGGISDLQGQANLPFAGSINVDRIGPRVISTSPALQTSAPFNQLTFHFNEALTASSVSLADISSFTAPDGSSLLGSLQNVTVDGSSITVRFHSQLAAGNYSLTIGPNILDLVGNPLDQDQDGQSDTYTITLQLQSPDLTVPTLRVEPVDSDELLLSARFGQQIDVTYTVANIGSDPAREGWHDLIYLSTDAVIDSSDLRLQALPLSGSYGPLPAAGDPEDHYTRTATVQLPLDLSSTPGTYFILIKTDVHGTQPESNENNNTATSSSFQLTLPPLPDLVISAIQAPGEVLSGQEVQITWTVLNQGTADFSGTLRDQVYLSPDQLQGNDQLFNTFDGDVTIPAGQSITRTQKLSLPIDLEGVRYVMIRTEALNSVFEHAGENNNFAIDDAAMNVILAPLPNLRVSSVTPPATAFSSMQTVVEWTVTNVGTGPTNSPIWYDSVYLSTDDVLDGQDVYLGTASNQSYLDHGRSYASSLAVTLPRGISGPYRFIVHTDSSNHVYEHISENDNARAGAITDVSLTPPPDLQVTSVVTPPQAFSGQPLDVTWVVTNTGPGQTLETFWYDQVYMSADTVLDGSDRLLGVFDHAGALAAGAGYSPAVTRSVLLPIGIEGDFYIFVRTDAYAGVFEHASEGNNVGIDPTPVHINLTPPPDLTVTAVNAPLTATANHQFRVTYTVANEGLTETPESYWYDSLYLSTDTTFDPLSDLLLRSVSHFDGLDVETGYDGAFEVTLPPTLNGVYYAFVVTDVGRYVFELDRENNHNFDPIPVTISFQPPNLVVDQFTVPAQGVAGSSILVDYRVKNVGIGDTATSIWTDAIVLSTDDVLDHSDLSLVDFTHNGLLEPQGNYSASRMTVPIPITVASGNYYLFYRTDIASNVLEHENEGDNASVGRPISIGRTTADLQVTAVSFGPDTLRAGDSLTVNWTVRNLGQATTNANYWYDTVTISSDAVYGNQDDVILGSLQHNDPLPVNVDYPASKSFPLPANLTGSLHVFVHTDSSQRVVEGDLEGNNVRISGDGTPTTVSVAPRLLPDLRVTQVEAPATAYAGQRFALSWTVQNFGPGDATAGWFDSVYLSLDQNFDSGDYYLESFHRPRNLLNGENYEQSGQFRIPQGMAGPYYVFVVSDSTRTVGETVENNNLRHDPGAMIVSLLPPANLVVGEFTVPINGIPGRNLTVDYTVTNQGTNPAQGEWVDKLYLSVDGIWDVNDLLLGQVNVAANVPGGSSYPGTLTAPAPGVVPGLYQVIVRSDILNQLPELSDADNLRASLNQVSFDVEALTLGVADVDELPAGASAFYKVVVPANETLRFTFDSLSNDGSTEIFVRHGAMPSRTRFDFTSDEPFQADQTLTVPADQGGTYYVLVYRRGVTGSASYSLNAELVPFSIASAEANAGGDAGEFTVQIEGAKFQPGTVFELVAPGADGAVYPAVRKVVQNSTLAYVTFNMTFAPLGNYTLRARNGNQTTTLATPFQLQASTGANVVTEIEAASTLRPGRTYSLQLYYANMGNQDTLAPLILVESRSGTPVGLSASSQVTGAPLQILGVSPEGPLGILRPGTRGSVFVSFSTTTVQQGVDLQVRRVLASNTTTITEQEWTTIEQSIRPGTIPLADWTPFWAGLRGRIGTTWGHYVRFLNQVLAEVGGPGEVNYDIKGLLADLYSTKPQFQPSSLFQGTLRDAATGNPLPNVKVDVIRADAGERGFAGQGTTDAQGVFRIGGLTQGTYELAVAGYRFDMDRDGQLATNPPQFVVTSTEDLTGVAVYVTAEDQSTPMRQDNGASLAVDHTGQTHIVWNRDGLVWHARHDGTSWRDAVPLSRNAGSNVNVQYSSTLVGGTLPGLIAVWEEGGGNQSEIVYAIGIFRVDGSVAWSEPAQLTDDELQDSQTTVSVGPDGAVLFAFIKQNAELQDDGDLYFEVLQVEPISLPAAPAAAATGTAGADLQPESGGAGVKVVPLGFEFPAAGINAFGLKIKGKVEGQVAITEAGCKLYASAGLQAQVQLESSEFKYSIGGDGQYKADYKVNPQDCVYEFDKARASWSVFGSVDWKNGLVHMIKYFGIQGRVAAFILEAAQNAAQKLGGWKFEAGINVKLGFRFAELEYTGTDPLDSPSRFLSPDSIGVAAVEFSFGPYLKGGYEGQAEAKASGAINIKFEVIPNFAVKEVSGSLGLEVKYPNGRYWSTTFSAGFFSSGVTTIGAGDGGELDALDVDLENLTPEEILALIESGELPLPEGMSIDAGYDPARAMGTGNVYGTNSVLSNVASDLFADGAPVVVTTPGGQRLMAWIRDHDPAEGVFGNSIWVSEYNGTSWSAPVEIAGSEGFNSSLALAYDAQNRAVLVWARADTSGVTPNMTHNEFIDAYQNSDVFYSVFGNGQWSTPAAVEVRTGRDSDLALAKNASGDLLAVWTNESTGDDRLLSAVWDVSGWSQVVQIQESDELSQPAIGTLGNQTVVFWSQNVSADPVTIETRLFSSIFVNGWGTPVEFDPLLLPQASSLGLLPGAAPVLESEAELFPGGLVSSLFKPDDDCCKCKLEEPPPPPDCGSWQTLDREKCEYVSHYKPCVVQPRDPNDIVNPEGFGEEHWITADQRIPYMIRFENAADASAPAQVVTITQTLDPDLNPNSFRLGNFGFDDEIIQVPENRAFYNVRLDLTESRGYFVDVAAGIDVAARQAFWTFTTIDPATGEQPLDADIGFLPVNNETGRGEGFVSYTIRPRNTVTTGTRIDAGLVDEANDFRATIVFDTEGPILTPSVFNTLDPHKPTSFVQALPAHVDETEFEVSWEGTDPNNGSGLARYTIYVSTDGGEFLPWLENTELRTARYVGELGHTYAFYSVAADNAGNVEVPPATPDTQTITPGGRATIGSLVWHDADADGIQDLSESGVEGMAVSLYRAADDTLVATTTTDSQGNYQFTDIEISQQYYLAIAAPGYLFSAPDQGASDDLDSDVHATTGRTAAFSVVNGDNLQFDAGLFLPSSLSGFVWDDADGDGSVESGETFLDGWTVYLDSNDNGQFDADLNEPFRLTDSQGAYSFDGLRPGTYIVAQVIRPGWVQTFPGPAGANATSGAGFQRTYAFTGSTVELVSPGGVEVAGSPETNLSTSTTTSATTSSTTSSSTTSSVVAGNLVGSGSGFQPWANLIQLDALRADPQFAGLDGRGAAVVIIDTGIDVDHPFFGPDADGNGVADRIVYQWDFADGDGDASDRTGHGSHVSSLLASQDAQYAGLLPGVNVIALKVFGDHGRGYFSHVEQALDWVIQHAADYNILAVNLSVGDGLNWSTSVSMHGLADELATLSSLNVLAVASAGNNYAIYGAEGLAYPAADPHTLAVGAVWDADRGGPWSFGSLGTDYTTGADRIVSFSQRSATHVDLFAPGAILSGANADGGVTTLRGTSMAAPQVTGAVVLAQQIAEAQLGRRLTLSEVRSLLRSSGTAIVDGDDERDSVANTGLTSFRLDVHAFAQAVRSYDGSLRDVTSPGDGDETGGDSEPVPQTGRPFRFMIELTAEQQRTNVNFGDEYVPPEVVDVSDITPDPRTTAVATVAFEFSQPIDIATLDAADFTLTRNSEPVSLAGLPLVFEQGATSTTYTVSGLNSVTGADGLYVLTLNGAGVQSADGVPAVGLASDSWTVDLTPPAAPGSLAIDPDTGTPGDGVTSTTSVTLTGSLGETGLVVSIFDETTSTDLGAAVVTGTSFTKGLTLAEGPHRLRIRAQDPLGNSADSFLDVLVELIPQAPIVTVAAQANVLEGSPLALNGSFSDPDSTSWTATVDYGDGLGSQPLALDAAGQFTLQHAYTNNGTYTVTVAVTDPGGLVGTALIEVQVASVAPTALVSGPVDGHRGVRGQLREFVLSASDPSSADQAAPFSYLVQWGDGSPAETFQGTGPITVSHTYRQAGQFPLSVQATDQDLAEGVATTRTVQILVAELQHGDLYVGGTTGADQVLLAWGLLPRQVQVAVNSPLLETFQLPAEGEVIVLGYAGTDRILVGGTGGGDTFELGASLVSVNGVQVQGQQVENWTLSGGAGADQFTLSGVLTEAFVLQGGDGSDTLRGADLSQHWEITGTNAGGVDAQLRYTAIENLVGGNVDDVFSFVGTGQQTGSIAGGEGLDTFDYLGASDSVTLDLQDGSIAGAGSTSGVEFFVGSLYIDTIIGPDRVNEWNFVGPDTGELVGGNAVFAGFENWTGGSYDDLYRIGPAGGVSGVLNGAGGSDTLDLSLSLAAVSIDMSTRSTSAVHQFLSVEQIVGSLGNEDRVQGADTPQTWQFSALNQFRVGGINFSGFEVAVGGIYNDSFQLTSAAAGLTGYLDGQGGNDTLVAFSTDNTWTVDEAGEGTLQGLTSFRHVEHLTGGGANDTFAFGPNGSIEGTLNAGGGSDTLNFAPRTSSLEVLLAARSVPQLVGTFLGIETIVGSGAAGDRVVAPHAENLWTIDDVDAFQLASIRFRSFEQAQGGSGNDTFQITTATAGLSGGLAGGDGNDSLRGPGVDSTWQLTSVGGGTLNGRSFSQVENLSGGAAADLFELFDGGALTGILHGGSGNDMLDYRSLSAGPGATPIAVDLRNRSATSIPSFLAIEAIVGSGGANDRVQGADAPNAWTIDGLNMFLVSGLRFSRFEQITGGSSSDTFNITSPASGLAAGIQGGDGGDTLRASNAVNLWQIEGANAGRLNAQLEFSQIENLMGGSDADTFQFLSSAASLASVNAAGGNDTLDFLALPGPVTVDLKQKSATSLGSFLAVETFRGSASADDVVLGTDLSTTWNLNGADLIQVSGLQLEHFESIRAGSGNDTFLVNASTSRLSGVAEGGDGVDSVRGPAASSLWTLTAPGAGDWNSRVSFLQVEQLTGGAADDWFLFQDAAALTGTINAGAGADTLDLGATTHDNIIPLASRLGFETLIGGSASDVVVGNNTNNVWTISGAGQGRIGTLQFRQTESLQGGTRTDTFQFNAGGALAGFVDGGGDSSGAGDLLHYGAFAASVVVDLSTGSATAIGQGAAGRLLQIRHVIGGAGDDQLTGDTAGNVLVGGSGRDILLGGAGRDLLIGGLGQDTLQGQAGGDLLIGNRTFHDSNLAALSSLLTSWNSAADYATRVDQLTVLGVGDGGSLRLDSTKVLSDASQADTLVGGLDLTDLDHFFTNPLDVASDLEGGELTLAVNP